MDVRLFLTLAAFTAFLAFLFLVQAILAPFLLPVVWAGAIGIATFPFYHRLHGHFGNRHNLAAAAMTAIVVFAIIGPMVTLLFFLVQEMAQVYTRMQQVGEPSSTDALKTIQYHPWVAPWIERLHALAAAFRVDIKGMLFGAANRATSFALGHLTDVIKNFFAFFISIIIMVITLFFIYRDGQEFHRQFWSIVPLKEENKELVDGTIHKVLMAIIYGIFLTCIIQGMLGGISFWFLGLPSPLLFGALMAIAALVPGIGTALVWAPAAIYFLLQGEVVRGVILIVWSLLIVSSIDNLIRPLFISGKADIPLLFVAFGALGGLASLGFTGILVGPIVLAVFKALIDIYRTHQSRDGIS